MSSLISVIMPAYNCAPYLHQAISSILNQTYENFELLICDDGSTDASWKLIDSFNDNRIRRFKNEKNLGYLQTYNFLLGETKGKYITCQDADDWSASTRLEEQISVFQSHPEISLCAANGTFYYSEQVQKPCPQFTSDYIKLNTNNFSFMLPTILYKREVLEKVKGFNPYFDRLTGMDQYFILSILTQFKGFEIGRYLYFARFNPTSNHRTFDSLRKLTAPDVYFMLKKQRIETGTDWLKEGKEDELLKFEKKLLSDSRFMAEKYREYAVYKIDFNQIASGFILICKSLLKTPFWPKTYRTIFYGLKKLILQK